MLGVNLLFPKLQNVKSPCPTVSKTWKKTQKRQKKHVFVKIVVFLLKPEWKVEIKNTNSHVFEVENACQQWENVYING